MAPATSVKQILEIDRDELGKLGESQIAKINCDEYRKGYALFINSFVSSSPQPDLNAKPTSDILAIPQIGQIFELTLDPGHVDPMQVVRNFERAHDIKGWKHHGRRVAQPYTRKFMLVQKGGHWSAITHACSGPKWYIPEGQWILAFLSKYTRPDEKGGGIGIADNSWECPYGNIFFPYGRGDGESWRQLFCCRDENFVGLWRWLVCLSD